MLLVGCSGSYRARSAGVPEAYRSDDRQSCHKKCVLDCTRLRVFEQGGSGSGSGSSSGSHWQACASLIASSRFIAFSIY